MEIKYIEAIRQYEATYIIRPDISDDELKTAIAKIDKVLQTEGVKVTNVEHWGVKKLAYTMGKSDSGYYVFVEFTAPASFVKRLETEFGYSDKIIRHLIIQLDKHAAAYNDKRRNKLKQQ